VAAVEADDVVEREEKCRAATLHLTRWLDEAEIRDGVLEMSAPFGAHAETMTSEQMSWRTALARPQHDRANVEAGLRIALATRGLDWQLREFLTAWDARAARAAWAAWDARDAWDAWDAWDARAAWDAGAAGDAWDAWDARAARAARAAWDARAAGAARDAWDAWDAWDAGAAWAAMTVCYTSLMGWIKYPADLLTDGLRDAYSFGLGIALPTGPRELGWAMDAHEGRTR
jgi:hypothetical protein